MGESRSGDRIVKRGLAKARQKEGEGGREGGGEGLSAFARCQGNRKPKASHFPDARRGENYRLRRHPIRQSLPPSLPLLPLSLGAKVMENPNPPSFQTP